MDKITSERIAKRRRDLGQQLARWRVAVGLTQAQLAKRISYSRSALACAETGRDMSTRGFWANVDEVVGANGGLLAAFDQMAALVRDVHEQRVSARHRERRQRAGLHLAPAATAGPESCQCAATVVGRWTEREVRALREALRMTVREFADRLGMSTATVSGWENRRTPATPKMAAQAALDQALMLADANAKARFELILQTLSHRS